MPNYSLGKLKIRRGGGKRGKRASDRSVIDSIMHDLKAVHAAIETLCTSFVLLLVEISNATLGLRWVARVCVIVRSIYGYFRLLLLCHFLFLVPSNISDGRGQVKLASLASPTQTTQLLARGSLGVKLPCL